MKAEWTNSDSLTTSQTTKAILVLNEMPKSCYACPLTYITYIDYGNDAYYGKHIRRCIFDDAEADANERYYDCPLKLMPEKNTWDITKNGHATEYAEGWNACLNEILGETE